jgi:hypothetical protein
MVRSGGPTLGFVPRDPSGKEIMVPSNDSRGRWLLGLLCLCGVLALAGCGKPGPGKLYPVSGKVTINGKPMTSGFVGFAPEASPGTGSRAQFMATGTIGSDGTYEIKTDGKPGAPLGKYKATINPGMPTTKEEAANMGKLPFDRSYTDPAKSPLAVEVVESPQAGAYDLKLLK